MSGHPRGNISLAQLAALMVGTIPADVPGAPVTPLRKGEVGTVEGVVFHEKPKVRVLPFADWPTHTYGNEPKEKVDPHKHTRQTERYLRQQAKLAAKRMKAHV